MHACLCEGEGCCVGGRLTKSYMRSGRQWSFCFSILLDQFTSLGRRKQGKTGALKGKFLSDTLRILDYPYPGVYLNCEVLRCTGSLADVPRT